MTVPYPEKYIDCSQQLTINFLPTIKHDTYPPIMFIIKPEDHHVGAMCSGLSEVRKVIVDSLNYNVSDTRTAPVQQMIPIIFKDKRRIYGYFATFQNQFYVCIYNEEKDVMEIEPDMLGGKIFRELQKTVQGEIDELERGNQWLKSALVEIE